MKRRWLFADQLGPGFLDASDRPVLLVESKAGFRRRRFHRRTAHLILSALRHRAAELGERACPYPAGEWWFLSRNEHRLADNARTRRPLQGLRWLKDLAEVVVQEEERGSAAPASSAEGVLQWQD